MFAIVKNGITFTSTNNNIMKNSAKVNFELYPIGSKIDVRDIDGYFISKICGVIVSHLWGGHAVIKNFSNEYWSTVGLNKAYEIELY